MGGKMYLGDQMVTPVIVDVSLEFKDIQGSPYDNTELKNALDDKQDVIEDLEEIRNGASAGATALQPSALSGYATQQWVVGQGYLTSSSLSGYATEQWVVNKGYITGITSSDVTTALGYTPYNSTNPNGYQANVLEGVQVNGTDLTITNKKVNVAVPTKASDIDAQPTLVSGTNIKTINNNSILGSGNIEIGGSGDDWGQSLQGDIEVDNTFVCAPYKCYANPAITSFSAQNVDSGSLSYCFTFCENLINVSGFNNVSSITRSMFQQCFANCNSLTTVPTFENVVSIGPSGMGSCFSNCNSLTTAPTFEKLNSIDSMGLQSCFSNCSSLTSLSFPSLKTTSFVDYPTTKNHLYSIIAGVTGCTIHFPSNLQTVISGLNTYPNFGGTNTTLAFDLPATS